MFVNSDTYGGFSCLSYGNFVDHQGLVFLRDIICYNVWIISNSVDEIS